MVDAALGEILTTCSKLEWLLNHGEQYLRPEGRSWNFMLAYKSSEVHYEPLGVVAGLVSWNYRAYCHRRRASYLMRSSSPAQRLVAHYGRYICW